MFPSKFFSTGGDELNMNCYAQDPETQQALQASGKTLEQALDTFTQSTHGALISAGKTPVVWEGDPLGHHLYVCMSKLIISSLFVDRDGIGA
jgi:hexosaminidase